jgi:hypothetical protein
MVAAMFAALGFLGMFPMPQGGLGTPGQTDSWAFIENRGQWPAWVRLAGRLGNATAILATDGFRLALRTGDASGSGACVHFTCRGAAALPVGERERGESYAFFRGNDPARWRSRVPAFAGARWPQVWPGVDLRLRTEQRAFAYDFVVSEAGRVSAIQLAVEGAERCEIEADGSLVVTTPAGAIRQRPPVAFVDSGRGARMRVDCKPCWRAPGVLGFSAAVDRAVLIDPDLEWSTFLGGAQNDIASAIRLDGDGRVVVAGLTYSWDFPTTPGAFSRLHVDLDGFVSRLDADGRTLRQSTFFGGGSTDYLYGLALGPDGSITVCGATHSFDLPTTPGAFSRRHSNAGGSWAVEDAFIARLTPALDALVFSTYLGGLALRSSPDRRRGSRGLRARCRGDRVGRLPDHGQRLPARPARQL